MLDNGQKMHRRTHQKKQLSACEGMDMDHGTMAHATRHHVGTKQTNASDLAARSNTKPGFPGFEARRSGPGAPGGSGSAPAGPAPCTIPRCTRKSHHSHSFPLFFRRRSRQVPRRGAWTAPQRRVPAVPHMHVASSASTLSPLDVAVEVADPPGSNHGSAPRRSLAALASGSGPTRRFCSSGTGP